MEDLEFKAPFVPRDSQEDMRDAEHRRVAKGALERFQWNAADIAAIVEAIKALGGTVELPDRTGSLMQYPGGGPVGGG